MRAQGGSSDHPRIVTVDDGCQHLEEIVEERTRTIRTILNNVRSGFFLTDANCKVREGFTRSCLELFGKDFSADRELQEILCLNEKDAFNVKFLLAQVFEDILPEDIALDQVPKNFNVGNKILSLEGNVVRNVKGEVANILFTVNDVTQLRAAEEESKLTRTLLGILQQMESFRNFLAECKQQLVQARSSLDAGNETGVRASLHTLKGNSASFGLVEIASIIHKIEDEQGILKEHLDRIESQYRDFLHAHVDILKVEFDTAQGEVFEIRAEQLESFSHRLHSGIPPEAFLTEFDHWFENLRLRPARVLLGPLAESCVRLASRLGKNVRVEIEGGNVLVDKEIMGPTLSNLIHLCRNSLDHGIEEIYERGTKPEQALLKVIFSESESHWEINIVDDGRGIDAVNVSKKALEMGVVTPQTLQAMSYDEKCHLIFASGLSTAESVSDISGRGVGMSAMESVVRETGGEILVHSVLGEGTSFKIRVPRHHAHTELDKSKKLLKIAS
jgi:two-component system chemotaxis sensor kinase CheA